MPPNSRPAVENLFCSMQRIIDDPYYSPVYISVKIYVGQGKGGFTQQALRLSHLPPLCEFAPGLGDGVVKISKIFSHYVRFFNPALFPLPKIKSGAQQHQIELYYLLIISLCRKYTCIHNWGDQPKSFPSWRNISTLHHAKESQLEKLVLFVWMKLLHELLCMLPSKGSRKKITVFFQWPGYQRVGGKGLATKKKYRF